MNLTDFQYTELLWGVEPLEEDLPRFLKLGWRIVHCWTHHYLSDGHPRERPCVLVGWSAQIQQAHRFPEGYQHRDWNL